MKKALLIGAAAGLAIALLTLVGASTQKASADAGPHVASTGATPDKCAACHRIHTGQTDKLLISGPTEKDFCYTCHGSTGAGSDLAVQSGKWYGNGSGPPYGNPKSTFGALRGGGFDTALIKTTDTSQDVIGTLTTAATTQSWHTVDGTTAGTLWGNGDPNSGAGPSYTLSCGSCHDPHGNGQYRILRPIPVGVVASAANVTDQADPKHYGVSNYLMMGADVSLSQISTWCATCHTRYLASSTAYSGDAIFSYRHISNGSSNRACITCHATHGSNAAMTGSYSAAVPWPGGGSGTTDNNNSRLLKMDNRGICIKCHWDK